MHSVFYAQQSLSGGMCNREDVFAGEHADNQENNVLTN